MRLAVSIHKISNKRSPPPARAVVQTVVSCKGNITRIMINIKTIIIITIIITIITAININIVAGSCFGVLSLHLICCRVFPFLASHTIYKVRLNLIKNHLMILNGYIMVYPALLMGCHIECTNPTDIFCVPSRMVLIYLWTARVLHQVMQITATGGTDFIFHIINHWFPNHSAVSAYFGSQARRRVASLLEWWCISGWGTWGRWISSPVMNY